MKKLLLIILRLYRGWRNFLLKIQGKTPVEVSEKRLVSGKTWDEFCDGLKSAGAALLHGNAPKDPFNQAEGYRYLARLLRTGLDAFLEHSDPEFPSLKRMVHETAKIGADNPDNYYQNAQISGEFSYRIAGIRNNISFLSFHTLNGNYGSPDGVWTCATLEGKDLILDAAGGFGVELSKEKKGKNWLKIEDETTLLIVRQTFLDSTREHPAELSIKCLDSSEFPSPFSPLKLEKALDMINMFVAGTAMKFSSWSNTFSKHPNQLPFTSESFQAGAGGDKNLYYYHSYYKLEEDECLVIETSIPECPYWNFQLNNYWMESLDYRYFRIHINKHTAHYNSDGSVTIIVSKHPVDHPNWLSTAGHNEGTMLWRWLKPDRAVEPRCRVVKRDLVLSV